MILFIFLFLVCPDCPDNYNAEELTWALVTLAIVTGLFLSICFCRFYPKLRQMFVQPVVTNDGEGGISVTSKSCQCTTVIQRGSINPITTSAGMVSPQAFSSTTSSKNINTTTTTTTTATTSSIGGGGGKIIGLTKSLVNDANSNDDNLNIIPKGGGRLSLSSYQSSCEPVLYSSSSSSPSTVNPHYQALVNQQQKQQQRSSSSSLISSGGITNTTTSTSLPPPSHSSIASSIASSSSASSGHHLIHQQQHKHKHPYPTHSYPNRSSTKSRSSSIIAPTTVIPPPTTTIDPIGINSCQQLILSCPQQQQTKVPIVPIVSDQSTVYTSHI